MILRLVELFVPQRSAIPGKGAMRAWSPYRAEDGFSPLNVIAVAPVTEPIVARSLTNS